MAKDLKVYNEAELKTRLANQLPHWSVENNHLKRDYKTDGWQTTLMVVNTIGFFAEAADHHPDLTVSWPNVAVSLQSHSAGGVTEMDLELAKKIEAAVLWRPTDDSVFEGGTSKQWVNGG